MSDLKAVFARMGYEVADLDSSCLGEGAYGRVYLATEISSGRQVAIKEQFEANEDGTPVVDGGIPVAVIREMSILFSLIKSPYVVKLLKVFHLQGIDESQPPLTSYMVFEYLQCDLRTYARSFKPKISDAITRGIMYNVLVGLIHCHAAGIIHRDVKPHNILMDLTDASRPIAKLADFGLGRPAATTGPLTQQMMPRVYRAPEVLLGAANYTTGVDVWSAGCVCAELYLGRLLFPGANVIDQLIRIFSMLGKPHLESVFNDIQPRDFWKHIKTTPATKSLQETLSKHAPMEAIELIQTMLTSDPAVRPTAKECIRHPYFASLFNEADLALEAPGESDCFLKPRPTH